MNIDYSNRDEIRKIYIHDSVFSGFNYTYEKREICLSCINYCTNKIHGFKFRNIILCNMQSCSFWHGGNSILGVSIDETSAELEKLIEFKNQNGYEGTYLDDGILYLTIEFELNSGDTLLIICESVEWMEDDYIKMPPEIWKGMN